MDKYGFIKDRLKQLGRKNIELADYLGIPTSRITDMIKGRREIQQKDIKGMSEFLGIDFNSLFDYVNGETNKVIYNDGSFISTTNKIEKVSTRGISVIGIVEAGAYRESETFEIDEQETLDIIPPGGYDINKVFGLVVRGNSMNKRFLPETRLICVSIDDCPTVESGKYVIAQRNRGGLYETTVKKFVVKADGSKWLVPESDDPKFKPISLDEGSPTEEIKIIACVIGMYLKL